MSAFVFPERFDQSSVRFIVLLSRVNRVANPFLPEEYGGHLGVRLYAARRFRRLKTLFCR